MRQVRYRAVIALDPAHPGPESAHEALLRHAGRMRAGRSRRAFLDVPAYLSNTHELMVRPERPDTAGWGATGPGGPGPSGVGRCFPAEICWDDEIPLHPGDRHVVTITLIDDEAPAFFGTGRRFSLWDGGVVGHGTISRKVFGRYGPC